jgi:hypothetical protein
MLFFLPLPALFIQAYQVFSPRLSFSFMFSNWEKKSTMNIKAPIYGANASWKSETDDNAMLAPQALFFVSVLLHHWACTKFESSLLSPLCLSTFQQRLDPFFVF